MESARVLPGEIERRYGQLIGSRAFLYAFVDTGGNFLLMNRGMRSFLGPVIPDSLFFCCAPEQQPSLGALLREAQNEPVSALVSVMGWTGRTRGAAPEALLWMDAEFSPMELRGMPVVQIVGMDVTEWVRAEQKLTSALMPSLPGAEGKKPQGKKPDDKKPDEKEPDEKDPPEEPGGDAHSEIVSERLGILNAFAERVAVVDGHGVCLAANALFILSFSGTGTAGKDSPQAALKPAPRVAGSRLLDLIPEDSPENAAFHRRFPEVLPERSGALECRLTSPEGEVLRLEVRLQPVEWAGLPAVMLTFRDRTALCRAQEQLERVTSVDYATGVLNRQGMERLMGRRVESAFRDRTPLSLILFDVDGLRRMNETQGYAVADCVMKALPAALKRVTEERGGDVRSGGEVIGRWGGDEFAILTSRSGASARTLANVLRDMAHGGAFSGDIPISLSAGVAELREDMDVSGLVGAAFDAMAAARRCGGNRTVLA